MGTGARDIDIGVGVHEIAGSAGVVDRVRAKLGQLRAEVAKPITTALSAGINAELSALKETLDLELELLKEAADKRLVSRQAAEQKETQLVATFQRQRAEIQLRAAAPSAETFDAEHAVLRARFSLDQAIVREGVAKRLQTEREGHEALSRLIEQFARDELTLRQKFGTQSRTASTVAIPTAGAQATDTQLGAIAGSADVALDRVRAKLGALRAELAKPFVTTGATNAFKQELETLQVDLNLELELLRDAANNRLISREAAQQKELALIATFTRQEAELRVRATIPVTDTFEAEHAALRARFALDQAIVREGVAKRILAEREGHAEITRLIDQFARDETALNAKVKGAGLAGLTPTATVGSARLGPQIAPAVAGPAQLGPALPAQFATAKQEVDQLSGKINVAIGAYQRMAQQINVTDVAAVAAFRNEGTALSAYLLKLGATDAELNVIAATITRLERRAGGATFISPVSRQALSSYDQLNPKLRTAANAASLLSVAAVTGNGSLQGMALAAGNVAQGLAVLTTSARVAAAATGIGAIVTVVATVVGLLVSARDRAKETKKALDDLGDINLPALQARRGDADREVVALEARARAAQAAVDKVANLDPFAKTPAALDANVKRVALEKVTLQLDQARAKQIALNTVIFKKQAEAESEATDRTIKNNQEALESVLRRTKGETEARREALRSAAREEEGKIRLSGAAETPQGQAAIVAIRRRFNEDILTVDREHAAKVADLQRQAAGQLAVLQVEQLNGEVAAQRKAIEIELADKVTQINREVGLEGVRAIRIAAARAEAIAKINKLEKDQQQKALELSREFAGGTAEAAAGSAATLERAIAAAQRQRLADQERIDKISIGDAEATATERFNLEVEADERRDATIEKARREHGAELRRISDETENSILELTGRASEARRNIINAEFDERIRRAKELKAPKSTVDTLNVQRDLELAKVDVGDLTTDSARALDALDDKLRETSQLAQSGAISERQARERVTGAYRDARQELDRIITALEDIAVKSGNDEAIRAAEQLRKKYKELGRSLEDVDDTMRRFKATAKGATIDAFAGFFEGLAHLGTQDKTEIRALSAQISATQEELKELLAIPAERRTGETNRRISELRGEIESTSVSLENAKQSITSWRDLFVSALQSIADALVRVSSQMLATALIEKLLGAVFGGGTSAASQTLSGDVAGPGFGRVNLAGGGPVEGPHGIDKVRANLTRREFVQPVSTVDYYGEDVMEIQRRRLVPRELLRAVVLGAQHYRHTSHLPVYRNQTGFFNSGGLVDSVAAMAARLESNSGGGSQHNILVELGPDLIARHTKRYLESPDGGAVVVTVAQKNARKLGLR